MPSDHLHVILYNIAFSKIFLKNITNLFYIKRIKTMIVHTYKLLRHFLERNLLFKLTKNINNTLYKQTQYKLT